VKTRKQKKSATALWTEVQTLLQVELVGLFQNWSELQRARLYVLFMELRTFGRRVEIPSLLGVEPSDLMARKEWLRGQQLSGIAVQP
jgi:hypothetical protein